MINALSVANNILHRSFSEDVDVNPMKLQRLIYLVYRNYLKKTGRSLFNERFETWKYGPVILSVHEEFKYKGSNAIKLYSFKGDIVNETTSPDFKDVADTVWNTYKDYDGLVLSSLMQKEGSAWKKAYEKKSKFLLDEDIRDEEIMTYR